MDCLGLGGPNQGLNWTRKGCPLMGVTKVRLVTIGVCPFIRDKGDRHKSEFCNLQDGSQLYANK